MAGESDKAGFNHDEPGVPAEIADALKELRSAPFPVPRSLDNAVLADASRVLARRRLFMNRGFRAVAAAAAIMLAGAGVWLAVRPVHGPVDVRQLAADVDADGRVDIVDAMVLAADVRSGRRGAGVDVNGDGVIDERDVDAVAHLAVRLNRGGA